MCVDVLLCECVCVLRFAGVGLWERWCSAGGCPLGRVGEVGGEEESREGEERGKGERERKREEERGRERKREEERGRERKRPL